jgi:hypothetical protein
MKNVISHGRRIMNRLNEAWEAGFQDIVEELMRGYERLTGKKRVAVPVRRRRHQATETDRGQDG